MTATRMKMDTTDGGEWACSMVVGPKPEGTKTFVLLDILDPHPDCPNKRLCLEMSEAVGLASMLLNAVQEIRTVEGWG